MTFLTRAEMDLRQLAVDLQQRERLSNKQIAERLGFTGQQVATWMRSLGYDAVAYHIESIAADIAAGGGFYAALHAHGIPSDYHVRLRARDMLIARGVLVSRSHAQQAQDDRPRCACGLLLEEWDLETGMCPSCNGDTERETERQAEEALFSGAAFLSNTRNIGRYDASVYKSRAASLPIW